MKLQDLKLEDFDFGREETAPVPEYNDYPNGTFMIVSKVAFLLGVDRKHFESEIQPPKMEWYNFLKNDRNARIVRNLCMLRNDLERNYSAVYTAMTSDVKNLNTLPQYISQEALTELEQDGILILKTNAKPVQYIIELNKKINDRINNCKSIFPIWLNWEYIKQLYIMPGGTSESGAKAAADEYYANRKSYPYQMYINWNGGGTGNILYNDRKFVTLLYESHEDQFWDITKVTDAGNVTKNGIYSFLDNSKKTAVVVDCENSNPYKVHAMLANLNQEALLNKICKIILYDDVHTTSAWGVLNEFTDIEVEHKIIDRLKEEKSLVDATLMLGAAREFYRNEVDSFILLSSDSDYWSLIRELEEARFFVMVEQEKCGAAIKKALVDSGITYCYLDDFCTGDSGIIIRTLLSEVKAKVDGALNLNIKRVLSDAIYDARADLTDSERKQFYDRYLKKMKLDIDPDGEVKIVLGE